MEWIQKWFKDDEFTYHQTDSSAHFAIYFNIYVIIRT
jgi:hypothetical protein